MNLIKSILQKEYKYFQRLEKNAQRLLFANFSYNLIAPLFGIFLNAFLWRQTHEFSIVALYNLMQFTAIPFGFYLNGLLLRRYSPSQLFFLGLLMNSLQIGILVFLPRINFFIVLLFGFIYGLGGGIFWANRNLLFLKTTRSDNRMYFSSLDSIINTITDIVVPFLLGWFIIFGSRVHIYSPLEGYKILIICLFFILIFIYFISMKVSVKINPFAQITLKNASSNWNKFRLFEFILGLLDGVTVFLPTLMILTFIGAEDILGTVQSITAIIAAIIVYILGKSLNTRHRVFLLGLSSSLAFFGAGFFGISYSAVGVFVFFACQSLVNPFRWMTINSINFDLIERENESSQNHYAHIFDQEIYLNAGRILTIAVFILLISYFSNSFALRFTPVIFAASQILIIFIARSIEKHHHAVPINTQPAP